MYGSTGRLYLPFPYGTFLITSLHSLLDTMALLLIFLSFLPIPPCFVL